MEQIKKQFLYYGTQNSFDVDRIGGRIQDKSIAFVEDPGFIWTHGHKYAYTESSAKLKGNKLEVFNPNGDQLFYIEFIGNGVKLGTGDSSVLYDGFDIDVIDTLNPTSLAPVQSRVIYKAIQSLINKDAQLDSDIQNINDDVATLSGKLDSSILSLIDSKQNKLTAKFPLNIKDDVITFQADTDLYVFIPYTEELPNSGNPNKIYLWERESRNGTYYEQYRYDVDNGWVRIGSVAPTVDLSGYVRQSDLRNYATTQWVTELFNSLDQSNTDVDLQFAQFRQYVDQLVSGYVKKWQDVYSTYGTDQVIDEPEDPSSPTPEPGGGTTIINNVILDDDFALTDNGLKNKVITRWKNTISAEVQNIQHQLDTIITDIDAIDLSIYNTRLGNLEQRVGDLENGLDNLRNSTSNSLRDLESTVDYLRIHHGQGISNLSQRINQLSSNVNEHIQHSDNFEASVISALSNKQGRLTAGNGIMITQNGVISTTIDTNVFVIVEELPTVGDPDKIYLLEKLVSGSYIYEEYRYKNGQFVLVGTRTPEVDLTGYLKTEEKNNILSYVDSHYESLGAVQALRTELQALLSSYQSSGDYATLTQLAQLENKLLDYVKWLQVYNDGAQSGDSTDEPGSQDEPTEPEQPSGHYKATNLVTLTTTQYQQLVDAGEVEEDVYYFTYEEETWGFGDKFPITLTDNWAFGGTFPVKLR